MQQQAPARIDQLEIKETIFFTVLLEAGHRRLGRFGVAGSALAAQLAQAHALAQAVHEWRGQTPRLDSAGLQDVFKLAGVAHEIQIAFAHGRDFTVNALKQHLLGVTPGNAVSKGLAQCGGFCVAGKGLVNLKQSRALAAFGLTWRAYFVEWANLPDLFPAWDVGFTRVAEQLAAADDGVRTYITPRGREHPTLGYLLEESPDTPIPQGFDGRICVRVATDVPARYYFLVNEDFRAESLLTPIYPDSRVTTTVVDTTGSPWARRLEQPAGGAVVFPQMQPQFTALDDGIDLLGHQLFPPAGMAASGTFYTRLYWRVSAPPAANYTAFAHLLQRNATGDLVSLAGADRPPGDGSCPTTQWLAGEVVIDELQFALPEGLPAASDAEYYVEIGFYTANDGRRLDIPDNAEDRILLGPLTLPKP